MNLKNIQNIKNLLIKIQNLQLDIQYTLQNMQIYKIQQSNLHLNLIKLGMDKLYKSTKSESL